MWHETPHTYSVILKARARSRSELAILRGYWAARIHLESEDGKGKSLGGYFDELLSDEELLEKSSSALAEWFDGQIDGGSATEQ